MRPTFATTIDNIELPVRRKTDWNPNTQVRMGVGSEGLCLPGFSYVVQI